VIVVADTSVVLNLCFLGLDRLLPLLFGEVCAPTEVESEFLRLAGEDARFEGLEFPKAIVIEKPQATGHRWAHSPSLHPGEIAALSLALELRASCRRPSDRW